MGVEVPVNLVEFCRRKLECGCRACVVRQDMIWSTWNRHTRAREQTTPGLQRKLPGPTSLVLAALCKEFQQSLDLARLCAVVLSSKASAIGLSVQVRDDVLRPAATHHFR